LGKKQFKKLSFQEPTLISATDNIHQTFRDNNHFANLPAFEVRLDFGAANANCSAFSFLVPAVISSRRSLTFPFT